MSTRTGSCLCGAVSFEITAEPIVSGACHCRDCQTVAGGAPGYGMLLPAAALRVTAGETRVYWSVADNGNRVGRAFCPDCGTHLFARNERHPEFVSVKAGVLDDAQAFQVMAHVWTDSAPSWHPIDPDKPSWPKDPDMNIEDLTASR